MRHRQAIALLALIGLFISLYLSLHRLGIIDTLQCGTGGCETVQTSSYAVFLGVPVAFYGVAGYVALLVVSLVGLQPSWVSRRGPIVLIGHSLGANAAVGLAQRLGERGIPIGLLVSFDATESLAVPANVERVLNIYQPIGSGRSLIATGGGFRGEMVSMDMSRFRNVSHTNIEKAENLHLLVIETISRLQRSAPRRAISQIN